MRRTVTGRARNVQAGRARSRIRVLALAAAVALGACTPSTGGDTPSPPSTSQPPTARGTDGGTDGATAGATGGATAGGTDRSTDRGTAAATADACTTGTPPPSAGPLTLWVDGRPRSYLLGLPAGYSPARRYPLVLEFHGYASTKELIERQTLLGPKGTARGYVVVTPDAWGWAKEWNWSGSVGRADDYRFVTQLLADVRSRTCIDDGHIYAAGHSNGAVLAGLLACELPGTFAAVATVSGTTPNRCTRREPVSMLAIHGTADPQVPYDGGLVGGTTLQVPPARQVVQAWADTFGCRATPQTSEPTAGIRQTRYTGCAGSVSVLLDSVQGGSHAWPGSPAAMSDPPAARTFDATTAILDFFDARHTS